MASETVLPDPKNDEFRDKADEERKAAEQEIVSPSKEDREIDEEQEPKSMESSSPEDPVIISELKMEDKHFNSHTITEAEKVNDTPHLHVPEVDVPKDASSVSDSAIEDVEKETEGPSSISDPLESTTAEAGEKLVEHLEVPLIQETEPEEGKKAEVPKLETQILESSVNEHKVGKESQVSELESTVVERPAELPEVGKEAKEGITTALEVEEKPQQETGVIEEVEKNQGLEVEEKPQEQSGVLEEVEKNQDLELVEKPQEQTGVLEVLEKKQALELEAKRPEQTIVLEVDEKKQASEVEKKLQEQTGVLEGEIEKEPTSTVEESSQDKTTILDGKVGKQLASEVEETPQDKIGILEGEVEKKLALEVEEKPREQTGVREELEQKLILDEDVKPQQTGVLEEVEKKPEIPESKEPTDSGIAKGEGILVDKIEETVKSDASNLEPSKDVNDLKAEGVMPKLEAPTKPTQKQSNNIMSKVKHSIVKVKKAIIGKSPSSKTISVDAKGDINVK